MLVGEKIGPFDVEKELGSGAMGSVYRAKYNRDGKIYPVALKVVALGLLGNEGALARFDREANILKQLKHPHIVRLIATGRYRGTPFIAMEYIDGEALDRTLSRRLRFSWEEVARVGKQLCEALQYAHERGIIHRDLKPSNLMVTKDGTLKLTDFGIAKDSDLTALTGANSTIGTAAYMSPEQCRGEKDLTNKSDLYSLGIVFFELLTGKKPFSADTTVDMFLKHVNERPPRPARFVPEIPGKFERLILQLLEKDKKDRPIDAAWVARYLAEIENDVFNQKSAAEEVANRRNVDMIGQDGTLTDEDRAAARALRGKSGSSKKKRLKREAEKLPLLQRPWVKAAGLSLALLLVIGTVVYGFLPPSADKLYAAVKQAEEAKDHEGLEAAVAKYVKHYGDREDEKSADVRRIEQAIEVRKREAVLARRFRNGFANPDEGDDKRAYNTAWDAMVQEKEGNLKRARDTWNLVRELFPDAKEPAKALWTWVAAKRIADLQAVEARPAALREKYSRDRAAELDRRYAPNDPEGMAIRALRLEQVGDQEKAARQWEALREQTEKNPDDHLWYLLATSGRARLPRDLDPAAWRVKRVDVVRNMLKAARAKAAEVPDAAADNPVPARDARNLCRDVIELMDDETAPDIKALVAEARKLLDSLPKPRG